MTSIFSASPSSGHPSLQRFNGLPATHWQALRLFNNKSGIPWTLAIAQPSMTRNERRLGQSRALAQLRRRTAWRGVVVFQRSSGWTLDRVRA